MEKTVQDFFKDEAMLLVKSICATESLNCRSSNKNGLAIELLKLAKIPMENLEIWEIPVDWDTQVVICFYYKESDTLYDLFAGIGNDGEFYYQVGISGKLYKRKDNSLIIVDEFNPEENVVADFNEGIDAFKEYFEQLNKVDWKVELYQLLEKYKMEEIQSQLVNNAFTDCKTKQEYLVQMKLLEHRRVVNEIQELLSWDF